MSRRRAHPEHGATAAYQQCKKRPGGACRACKDAWNGYHRARYLRLAQQAWAAAS